MPRTLPKFSVFVERFELSSVDKAAIVTEAQKAVEQREAKEQDKPTKSKSEIITEEAVRKPIQKEMGSNENPTVAKTDKNPLSRQNSEPADLQTDKGISKPAEKKPSVKEKLDRYAAQAKQRKEAERTVPETENLNLKRKRLKPFISNPNPNRRNRKRGNHNDKQFYAEKGFR